jgi:dihydroxyacetone kinase DhaKLM complex PTS-EIIA-like component DhaM
MAPPTREPAAPVVAPADAPEDAPETDVTSQPTAEELQALIAQVQSMQAELNAARGMPTDPVGAAAANLKAHVTARHNSGLPHYAELKNVVDKLGEEISSKESDLVRTIAAGLRDHFEGADYIKALANDLHKAVLTG